MTVRALFYFPSKNVVILLPGVVVNFLSLPHDIVYFAVFGIGP